MFAVSVPLLITVGAFAMSQRTTAVRRQVVSSWMSYVAMEQAESALSEAAHRVTIADLFDPAIFGAASGTTSFASDLFRKMANDQLPALPADHRAYRSVERAGAEVRRMLVSFRFPTRSTRVTTPGSARTVARENAGLLADAPDDLAVTVHPLSFHREFRVAGGHWVTWGVLAFRVAVRFSDPRGPKTHEIVALRRFTLRDTPSAGADALRISAVNLSLMSTGEDR